MPHPYDIHVGSKIREARALKQMSQEQLGKILGISFQQVQKYEKGTNRVGSGRLWEISHILEQPVTFFFDGIDGNKTAPPAKTSSRSIRLAQKIDTYPDEKVRKNVLNLIDALPDAR